METCPLCGRALIGGPSVNEHHLIPKSFKGKEKVKIHRVCHRALHAAITEREMASFYHTFERLREHPEVAKFIAWVKRKDPEFYSAMRKSNRQFGRRKR